MKSSYKEGKNLWKMLMKNSYRQGKNLFCKTSNGATGSNYGKESDDYCF